MQKLDSQLQSSALLRLLLGLWLSALVALVSCQMYDFGPVIVDGFQSAGAYADSQEPFDLHWPLMHGFNGFDQSWGFHWPGWPAFRTLLAPIYPWSAAGDIVLIAILWAVVCAVVSERSAKLIGSPWLVFPLSLGLMTEHRFLIGALSYRPEVFGSLLFLGFGWGLFREWRELSTKLSRLVLLGSGFMLPLVIPEGVAVPLGLLVFWVVMLKLSNSSGSRQWKWLFLTTFSVAVGCGALALHYLIPNDTWSHLHHNLEAQSEIPKGLFNTLRLAIWSKAGIGSAPIFYSSLLLTLPALGYSLIQLRTQSFGQRDSQVYLLLASLMLCGLLGVTLLTQNVNSLRLVLMTPWTVVLLAAAFAEWRWAREGNFRSRSKLWLATIGVMVTVAVMPATFFVVRCLRWNHLKGIAIRSHAEQVIAKLPDARVTYIPVGLWEAAIRDPRQREFRFATFPNLALKDYRRDYESHVYADLQPGDLLVFDVGEDEGGGPFPNATEARMQILDEDVRDWSKWELLETYQYRVGKGRAFQREWRIYQRKSN